MTGSFMYMYVCANYLYLQADKGPILELEALLDPEGLGVFIDMPTFRSKTSQWMQQISACSSK